MVYSFDYQAYNRTNRNYDAKVSKSNIVYYEDRGELESGRVGVLHKMQISTTVISDLAIGDKFHNANYTFEVTASKLMKNPAFTDYYQVEVKQSVLEA